jgi:hypothetical protein
VLTRCPTSAVAPEAQYYLAVARYKASHEGADLAKGWHRAGGGALCGRGAALAAGRGPRGDRRDGSAG